MAIRRPIFVVPQQFANISGPSASGYPASHLGRLKALGLVWRNDGGGALTCSFGTARAIDFVALIGANAKPATTIRVQAGSFDSGVQPFIDPAITRHDEIYHSFTELPAVQTVTSATVTIAHSGVFEGGILVMGRKIEPSKFWDYDCEFGIEDTGTAEMTRSAVWNAQDGMIARTLGMVLNWQSEAEWEGKFRPMIEQVGTTQPIYLCFDPEAGPYRQNRTFYGTFRKPPVVSGRRKPKTFGGEYQVLSLI